MFQKLMPFAADLWKHRGLLWQFTLRNVELRHKGSHLGLVWSFLNPLLMLGLYVFVFGYIFGGTFGIVPNESRIEYALGIFLGLTLFHIVAEVLGLSPTVIVSNPNFVKKVIFPLEVLPAANVGAGIFHLLISLALVLLGILFFGPSLTIEVLWLPVILLPLVLMLLGLAWLFSAVGVFFRDIGQVMQFVSMGLMFSSAVFYSAQKIPAAAWMILRFNPILLAIELARDAVLWHRPVNFAHLAYLYACAVVICYLGHAAFRRMKPAFADVL
ncbi:MAG TPA: ABC transporter permease [Candidatus Didemnitutus sp.]|nr:ABC transporter permease [Candidatus Didemnitutus sp.]